MGNTCWNNSDAEINKKQIDLTNPEITKNKKKEKKDKPEKVKISKEDKKSKKDKKKEVGSSQQKKDTESKDKKEPEENKAAKKDYDENDFSSLLPEVAKGKLNKDDLELVKNGCKAAIERWDKYNDEAVWTLVKDKDGVVLYKDENEE